MRKWTKAIIFLFIVLFVTGCGQNKAFEPEEINPEIDVCEVCNMGIDHENFATEVISSDGVIYKFDDIGCMVEFVETEMVLTKDEVAKEYVRDVNSGEWIELKDAYHAYHEDFWTPMANGIVTFKTEEEAQKYIESEGKGELYDFEKLKNHPWSWQQ